MIREPEIYMFHFTDSYIICKEKGERKKQPKKKRKSHIFQNAQVAKKKKGKSFKKNAQAIHFIP